MASSAPTASADGAVSAVVTAAQPPDELVEDNLFQFLHTKTGVSTPVKAVTNVLGGWACLGPHKDSTTMQA